jgi:hypothetical protein
MTASSVPDDVEEVLVDLGLGDAPVKSTAQTGCHGFGTRKAPEEVAAWSAWSRAEISVQDDSLACAEDLERCAALLAVAIADALVTIGPGWTGRVTTPGGLNATCWATSMTVAAGSL